MSLAFLGASLLAAASAPGAGYTFTEVAGARPDECFNGVGQPYLPYGSGCPGGTTPKRNQVYPWSLTRYGDKVFIGTGGGVTCFGSAALTGGGPLFVPGVIACEGQQSLFPLIPTFLLPIMGDWRPPQVWCYDATTGTQTEITPPDSSIALTMGIRAAGNNGELLLMAGPTIYGLGIVFYAWDLPSLNYRGSWASTDYSDVRKMVLVGGDLYIGVQRTVGGGAILRHTGGPILPFLFETVGLVDDDAAYIVEHQGRLVVATWPPSPLGSALGLNLPASFPDGGLWVSPPVPPGGLTWFDQFFWKKVWSVGSYEPDPVIAGSYLVGEPVSFGDYVLFGTMNVWDSGRAAILRRYGSALNTPETRRKAHRPFAFFRIKDLGQAAPHADLLYGAARLNRYDPSRGWLLVDNNMGGVAPMHGQPGFGNPYNGYAWSAARAFGKVFVGTTDFGFFFNRPRPGADLWCFPDPDSPAELVHDNGLTSAFNMGLRNMLGEPDRLYVGATNFANVSPTGGWKLIEVLEN
jgi:hypothetical protein